MPKRDAGDVGWTLCLNSTGFGTKNALYKLIVAVIDNGFRLLTKLLISVILPHVD